MSNNGVPVTATVDRPPTSFGLVQVDGKAAAATPSPAPADGKAAKPFSAPAAAAAKPPSPPADGKAAAAKAHGG